MEKIIIDTNCLISFVSDRNPDQHEKIATLFDNARRLKELIVCHHHVLSEFVFVLTSVYTVKAKNVQTMLADLVAMPGISFTSDVDIQTLLSLWPESIPDYGDAVIAAYCKKQREQKLPPLMKNSTRP